MHVPKVQLSPTCDFQKPAVAQNVESVYLWHHLAPDCDSSSDDFDEIVFIFMCIEHVMYGSMWCQHLFFSAQIPVAEAFAKQPKCCESRKRPFAV